MSIDTEDEALASLLEDIYGSDVPSEENAETNLTPQEHQQEEVQEHPQEQQSVDANESQANEINEAQVVPVQTAPVDTNKELIDRLMQMQEQQMQQNQMLVQELAKAKEEVPQLSEEELAMQELKTRLGLDKVEQENQMLRQQLEQVLKATDERAKQEAIMQQQMQFQEQMRVEVNNFRKEFPDVKEETVMDFIKLQPKEAQHQFDTPQGWRMIASILKSQAQPANVPDAMTTTQSSSAATVSASSRKKAGESVSDTDLAMELLGLTK